MHSSLEIVIKQTQIIYTVLSILNKSNRIVYHFKYIISKRKRTVMTYNNTRSYYPTYQEQRTNLSYNQRPQTPTNLPNNNYQPPPNNNRSFTKFPNPHNNRPNISRSRVSVASSHVQQLGNLMADNMDVFPEDMLFLIMNEQKNINNMKEKIHKEKNKVENDFAVFRTEIDHILQDIKISIQAELDLIYKSYITKYAELKGEVQELRLLRKEILMNNNTKVSLNMGYNPTISNKDLVNEIEKDAEHMRNFKVFGYLTELQKQKMEPITDLSTELILISAAECSFYRGKELSGKLREVKMNFGSFIKQVFDNITEYVISPKMILQRQKEEAENTKEVLRQFDMAESKLKPFQVHYPNNHRQENNHRQQNNHRHDQSLKMSKEMKKPRQLKINNNKQGCLVKWCDQVKLNRMQRVETDHSDSILCIYFVNDQYIATGSKDNTINIYSYDGKKIRKLKGHDASICCLSTVRNINGDTFLASGSDHGCSSLVLWDIRSWTMTSKIQAHSAAVTGIVDLQDGRHVATGSYDKKINIYNMVKNQITLSLNNNKTSVTGMVINADKTKLVTSGLDKSIAVWSIVRKNGYVEEIVNDKIIYLDELICQIQCSMLRKQVVFCAARDGSLRVINLNTEKTQQAINVSSNSLIELVVIEREMNASAPMLITCSAKDSQLSVAKLDSNSLGSIKLSGGLGIEYGCGIGPKMVVSNYCEGMAAIVNQGAGSREFSLYEIDLK